jgi:hypothetical protein
MRAPAEVLPGLEEALVIGVLRDPRPVRARAEAGEDAGAERADLLGALARTYRDLGAPRTLLDMLRLVGRGDRRALGAIDAGAREGWR